MKEETPKCNTCGQPMILIDAIGRSTEIVELVQVGETPNGLTETRYAKNFIGRREKVIGRREMALYQCPECKDVKIY